MNTAVLAALRAYAGTWDRAVELYACHLLGRTPGPRWVLRALQDGTRLCRACNRSHAVVTGEVIGDTCPTCGSFDLLWVDSRKREVGPPKAEQVRVPGGTQPAYTLAEWACDFSRWVERNHGRQHLEAIILTRVGTPFAPPMSHRAAAKAMRCDDHTVKVRVETVQREWRGR